MYDKWNLVHTFDGGDGDIATTSSEFEDDLGMVVQHMDSFLKGAGFVYDGALVIDCCAGCCGCDEEDE